MSCDTALDAALTRWSAQPNNLLQILIDLQRGCGGLPLAVREHLAQRLGLSRAEVDATASFYSFLDLERVLDVRILFSDSITDRWLGNRALLERMQRVLRTEAGSDASKPSVSFGVTSCTGLPDQGPAMLVNGRAVPHLTSGLIDEICQRIEAGSPVAEWPGRWFHVDSNLRRAGPVLTSALEPGSVAAAVRRRGSEAIFAELDAAGLGGRGGAGFPLAAKWRSCAAAPAAQRIVVCNADEGEPGTFKDRALLQTRFDTVVEGMILCASLIGASQGFIYLRGEYLFLLEALQRRLQEYRAAGELGDAFDIAIHLGAGSYICGEESALIESLEGHRPIPRVRPPFPVTSGYLGFPTVVNNVETFANAALIAMHGAKWFRASGTERSPGTKLLSISGDCSEPGVYEFDLGVPLQEVLAQCGAGEPQAVQVAGAAGSTVPPGQYRRRICSEDLATGGSIIVAGRDRDLLEMTLNFSQFFAHESCGHCTPCRVGTVLVQRGVERLGKGLATRAELEQLRELTGLMQATSHCGLGKTAGNPLRDLLQHFPQLWQARAHPGLFTPAIDLQQAQQPALSLRGATGKGNQA